MSKYRPVLTPISATPHFKDFGLLGGVVKSAVIPARVGIQINLGPNTTLLVRILDSRLRGNDGNMQ